MGLDRVRRLIDPRRRPARFRKYPPRPDRGQPGSPGPIWRILLHRDAVMQDDRGRQHGPIAALLVAGDFDRVPRHAQQMRSVM